MFCLKKISNKKYIILIGIFIFAYIISKINVSECWQILKKTDYDYLLLALGLTFVIITIKSLRWNYLKHRQGIHYSLIESFLMYATGILMGAFTPGRLGALSKIFYLKNDNYSTGRSAISVILDQLLDLAFMFLAGATGFLFFFSLHTENIVLFMFILGALLLIVSFRSHLFDLLKKALTFVVPIKYQKSWHLSFNNFVHDLKKYSWKNLFYSFALTFLVWLLVCIQAFYFAQAINITTIPFFGLAMIVSIIGFITLVPISVMGLGTREATLILLFSSFAISAETAISFSILLLIAEVFPAAIGLVCWAIKPISFRAIKKTN